MSRKKPKPQTGPRSNEICHITVFAKTKSGTRAYEYNLTDGDIIQIKYNNDGKRHWYSKRNIDGDWFTLGEGESGPWPELGSIFHLPVCTKEKFNI